jgi:hypothetical protein
VGGVAAVETEKKVVAELRGYRRGHRCPAGRWISADGGGGALCRVIVRGWHRRGVLEYRGGQSDGGPVVGGSAVVRRGGGGAALVAGGGWGWRRRSHRGKKTGGDGRCGEEAVGGRDEEVTSEEGEAELIMKENDVEG